MTLVTAAAMEPAKSGVLVPEDKQCDCGICGTVITDADQEQILKKKLATGYCLDDSYALRAFLKCCKEQGTEKQMEELRVENPQLWKSTVQAFRDQRSTGQRTRFDIAKHVESVKKKFIQDDDTVFRPLLFAQYLKFHQDLPQPLTLTEQQAVAQWHEDLRNPKVKKSEKRYWNPKTQRDEAAWLE